jgi:uncharacterized protein YndB with AHSA1/START domain
MIHDAVRLAHPIADNGDIGADDYVTTRSFMASPATVFDALTTIPGLSGWWAPVTGSGATGGELAFSFYGTTKIIRVDTAEASSTVRWTILSDDMTPEWDGTTIAFDLLPAEGGGTQLHFVHRGLVPQLECFDKCSAGWAYYLGSLVDYVDAGHGTPAEA